MRVREVFQKLPLVKQPVEERTNKLCGQSALCLLTSEGS
jgi:hypothetical protein